MKRTTGNKIRLGVFVSIAVVLFIAGIYFIGAKQQLFSSTFALKGVYKDVGGLLVGNNVRFSGINIGTVESIEIISDTTVVVGMVLEESTRKFIKNDAKAIIGSDGLMGNKVVNILPGTSQSSAINDNDYIQTAVPVSMDEILYQLKITAQNASAITDNLFAITYSIRSGKGTIGKLFMDTVFAENLDQAVLNIRQGTKGFEQNMDAAKNSFLLRGVLKKKKSKPEENN